MLTVIVISQVLIDSEEQRRKVAMGGDSDINGSWRYSPCNAIFKWPAMAWAPPK